MAQRPVFYVSDKKVKFKDIEFTWYSGFAVSQKQKCIRSLHENIRVFDSGLNPLEISTKSENDLGRSLSAFNLRLDGTHMENIYQASKAFEQGGPYADLLSVLPREAKRDERLRSSGRLTGYVYDGIHFALEPKTAFYDYIYLKAVLESKVDYFELRLFNGFTDIEFNPKRSFNTQARSVAMIRLMLEEGISLEAAVADPETFIKWYRESVRG